MYCIALNGMFLFREMALTWYIVYQFIVSAWLIFTLSHESVCSRSILRNLCVCVSVTGVFL